MKPEEAKRHQRGTTSNTQGGKIIPTFDGMNTDKIASVFSKYQGQIGQLVSKEIKDRFVQIAITMIAQDRVIKECTQESVLGAFLTAAMYGLELLPQMGHCYFVPYRNKYKNNMKELQFQIGYQGLVELMKRGGIKDINAHVIYEKDEYDIQLGMNPKIYHKPKLFGNRGKMILVYGVIDLDDGHQKIEWMNEEQVHKRRAKSRSAFQNGQLTGIWKDWPEEMWCKTIIRQMRKTVKLQTKEGPDVQNAIMADGAVITQNLLQPGGKIDLTKVQYPDHDNEPTYDTSTSQEQPKAESDYTQDDQPPRPDQLPINAAQLKFLVDKMREANIHNMLDYLAKWHIEKLSTKAIKIETMKGILYDLGIRLDLDDPGRLIDEATFHLDKEKKPAEEIPNGQVDSFNDAEDEDTVEESPPDNVKDGRKKCTSANFKEIRDTFKAKNKSLQKIGIGNIGDLLMALNIKSLSATDCYYEDYQKLMLYMKQFNDNPEADKSE